MDYAALKTEISDPKYNGMDDAAIAAALNAPTVAVQGDITNAQALTWCATQGTLLRDIEAHAANANSPIQGPCYAATKMWNELTAVFALSSANIQQLIGALVAVGLINSSQQAALMALGQTMVSRASQLGFGRLLDFGDIIAAREAS